MSYTQEVEITKNGKGWGVRTAQHWDDGGQPAVTHYGARTLAWAIFEAANWAGKNDTKIVSLTVKGTPYPRALAEEAVRKITDGMLAYARQGALEALSEVTR